MTTAILDHHPTAIGTGQHFFPCQFNTLLAFAIHTGKTDDMSKHFARRIKAAKLLLLGNPRDAESHHLIGQLGIDLTLQINKFALALCQLAINFFWRKIQQTRQFSHFGRRDGIHIGRTGPNSLDGCTDSQWLAIAIRNQSPVGFQHQGTLKTGIALIHQKRLLCHLQINGPANQASKQQGNDHQHKTDTHGRQRQHGLGLRYAFDRLIDSHYLLPAEMTCT